MEQFVERVHQSGKRDNIRTHSMRNLDRKSRHITRKHYVDRDSEFNEIKEQVKRRRKRKRNSDDVNPRPTKQQERKEAREKQ
jgi:hypothetical protein